MNTKKLTEKEITSIQEVRRNVEQVQVELGRVEYSRLELSARRANVEKWLEDIRTAEVDLAKELQDKYGDGSIDLGEGLFIPTTEDKKDVDGEKSQETTTIDTASEEK
tara:strand:- start:125 stop:448 length:324 start_codon:yes stop_codon:yes gene_type:complete